VRRTLEGLIVGLVVEGVRVVRRDVIATARDPAGGFARNRSERSTLRDVRPSRVTKDELLVGAVVDRIERRGKRLAIIGADGRALDVHLGMTGMVCVVPARGVLPEHAHVVWTLGEKRKAESTKLKSGGEAPLPVACGDHPPPAPRGEGGSVARGREQGEGVRMVFRDPRRFGGVWTCSSVQDLRERRWGSLGPDALAVTAAELGAALRGSQRGIKAVLLDQTVIAGVGNIYADESLFGARIHPEAVAGELGDAAVARLAEEIRAVLGAAVEAGGSTIRDYAGPEGAEGSYQDRHRVYGKAGQPCPRCRGGVLVGSMVAQRTTTFCPRCQGVLPHRVPTARGHVRRGLGGSGNSSS
jgi:formamidopyrimidine-DNA glycosylase